MAAEEAAEFMGFSRATPQDNSIELMPAPKMCRGTAWSTKWYLLTSNVGITTRLSKSHNVSSASPATTIMAWSPEQIRLHTDAGQRAALASNIAKPEDQMRLAALRETKPTMLLLLQQAGPHHVRQGFTWFWLQTQSAGHNPPLAGVAWWCCVSSPWPPWGIVGIPPRAFPTREPNPAFGIRQGMRFKSLQLLLGFLPDSLRLVLQIHSILF